MTSITTYNFNELTTQTQDEIIDNELTVIFNEIFYLPHCHDYPDYVWDKIYNLLEKFDDDVCVFVDEAKKNEKLFHYFRNIVVYNLQHCFFVPKLQKAKNNTHQSVILIN